MSTKSTQATMVLQVDQFTWKPDSLRGETLEAIQAAEKEHDVLVKSKVREVVLTATPEQWAEKPPLGFYWIEIGPRGVLGGVVLANFDSSG